MRSRTRFFPVAWRAAYRRVIMACVIGLPILSAVPAHAQQASALPGLDEPDKPTFFFTGYLWATALNGQIGTLPPLPPANVNLGFGDILQHLDGGIMGAGEMRLRRWSVLFDTMYTQVSPSATLSGPFQSAVSLQTRSLTVQADVLYRLYDNPAVSIDVGPGLRYWHLNNQFTLDASLPGDGQSITEGEGWVDPLIVARVSAPLGGRWSATLVGDVGGFDVGSQLTYQAIGTINYQCTQNLALRLGYRFLSVDYTQGDYLYDVHMQGPIIGVTYRF